MSQSKQAPVPERRGSVETGRNGCGEDEGKQIFSPLFEMTLQNTLGKGLSRAVQISKLIRKVRAIFHWYMKGALI
jgi:hypothetical protein